MGNYIDLTYANTYIQTNPIVNTRWNALSDAQKGYWIDFAEQQVDNVNWIGEKTVSGQTAEFPRSGMMSDVNTNYNPSYVAEGQLSDENYWYYRYDIDPNIISKINDSEDVIFDDLKIAVCETIVEWIRTQKFQTLLDLQKVNIGSFSAGSVNFNFNEMKSQTPLPEKAWNLMYMFSRVWWKKLATRQVGRI